MKNTKVPRLKRSPSPARWLIWSATSSGASGPEHSDCAQTCIKMGLPVGIKVSDGRRISFVGEHKPINAELAALAAKTITVKGKAVSRDGFNMIENAEIVKK